MNKYSLLNHTLACGFILCRSIECNTQIIKTSPSWWHGTLYISMWPLPYKDTAEQVHQGCGFKKDPSMKQYHSDREQEEEEDMEQINHRQEAARCITTLSKLWKKTAWAAKVLGERSLLFGVLIHYWSKVWCAIIASQFQHAYPLGLMTTRCQHIANSW